MMGYNGLVFANVVNCGDKPSFFMVIKSYACVCVSVSENWLWLQYII